MFSLGRNCWSLQMSSAQKQTLLLRMGICQGWMKQNKSDDNGEMSLTWGKHASILSWGKKLMGKRDSPEANGWSHWRPFLSLSWKTPAVTLPGTKILSYWMFGFFKKFLSISWPKHWYKIKRSGREAAKTATLKSGHLPSYPNLEWDEWKGGNCILALTQALN